MTYLKSTLIKDMPADLSVAKYLFIKLPKCKFRFKKKWATTFCATTGLYL